MRLPPDTPARVVEVDLDVPTPGLASVVGGRAYEHALILVWARGRPIGTVAVDLRPAGLSGPQVRAAIRAELGEHEHEREHPASTRAGAGPSVTVVIPTRDRPQQLAACLDALLGGQSLPREVVVVDSAPVTGVTRTLVAERAARDPRVRYLVEPRPGAALARARGFAAATSELVAFVDDDVELDRRWVGAVVAAFASDEVHAVTTLIFPRELETRSQLLLEQFGGFAKGFERTAFDLGANRRSDPLYPYSPGIYGSGAAMAFRTRTLRELGGPDPRLTNGGEDLDLFLQVVLSGRRLVYEPAAVAWHRHPSEPAALRRTMFVNGTGLTGLMTKWLVSDRATSLAILRRLPAAARLALDPGSRKNAGKPPGYPRELTAIELAGMLVGPIVFARRAVAARRRGARALSPGSSPRA